MSSAGGNGMSVIVRLLGGWQGPVTRLLIISVLTGSAVWKFQSTRYAARLARLQAALVASEAKAAAARAQLTQAQTQVVTQVEIRYRDRLKIVKEKGDTIIKEAPVYVTSEDSARFGVNIGFVRSYNAAFSGIAPRPPAESDRRPAGLPLTEIAQTNAFNASVCRQWREQALEWRQFYRLLQKTRMEN